MKSLETNMETIYLLKKMVRLKNWVIEKEYDSSSSTFSDILKQIENTEFYHRLDL